MSYLPHTAADFAAAQAANPALPQPLDCESCITLGFFLTPILESAESWTELMDRLDTKGYALRLIGDHLVLVDTDMGKCVCTTDMLGVTLRALADRLGAPRISGDTGHLRA